MNPVAAAAASQLATGAADVFPAAFPALPAGVPPWVLVVTVLPVALVLLTAFARISISLAFLRHGMGLPDVPSGTVAMGLAAILSLVAMAPVVEALHHDAFLPYSREEITALQAGERVWPKLAAFMDAQTRAQDRVLMQGLLAERHLEVGLDAWQVRVPAFVVSELKSGFQIGLVLWLPFLVVELLVGALLSVSGLSLEVRRVALPAKLLLFVAVDGWTLLVAGLVRSFGGGT